MRRFLPFILLLLPFMTGDVGAMNLRRRPYVPTNHYSTDVDAFATTSCIAPGCDSTVTNDAGNSLTGTPTRSVLFIDCSLEASIDVVGAGGSAHASCQYSTNGGTGYADALAISRLSAQGEGTTTDSGLISVDLNSVDLSQIIVRARARAVQGSGESGASATVSNWYVRY